MNKEYQKMNKIEPYNDKKLTYDENTKRYFLTLETVKSNLPETITDDGILTYRIKKNTRIVYNYILSHCHSSNRKVVVDLIAHTEEYRNWIYEVLMAQMEADLFNGYNDLGLQPAQNTEERMLQIEQQVCIETQSIIYSSLGYGNVNIMAAYPISGVKLQ